MGLYFSSRLLNIVRRVAFMITRSLANLSFFLKIQQSATTQRVDGHALARAVLSQVTFTLLSSVISRTR